MKTIAEIVGAPFAGTLTSAGFWDWTSLIGGALITSAMILTFLYLWSSLFRDRNLTTFVKVEMFELFTTVVLMFLVVGMAGAVASLGVGAVVPGSVLPEGVSTSDNLWVVSGKYFEVLGNDMGGWLELNYAMNVYIDSMASVTQYSRPLGVGMIAAPLAGFASPLKQLLYNMSVALAVAYVINYAQLYVVTFALVAFLKYYLPLGVVLRAFTPTRKIGGTIIGIALAFLFIYPSLVVMNYMMFYNKEASPMVTFRSFAGGYLSGGASLSQQMGDYIDSRMSGSFFDIVSGTIGGIGTMLEKVIGGMFTVLMMIPISIVGLGFAIGVVMPIFNVMMFIQAARFLSKGLGEEMDVSSLTRMV